MNGFSHFNEEGRARMVDISDKSSTVRTAAAISSVHMKHDVYSRIKNREIGKGDVLAVAQVAGIMAAKQTSAIIPMCHPLSLSSVDISFGWEEKGFRSRSSYTGKRKNEREYRCGNGSANFRFSLRFDRL